MIKLPIMSVGPVPIVSRDVALKRIDIWRKVAIRTKAISSGEIDLGFGVSKERPSLSFICKRIKRFCCICC